MQGLYVYHHTTRGDYGELEPALPRECTPWLEVLQANYPYLSTFLATAAAHKTFMPTRDGKELMSIVWADADQTVIASRVPLGHLLPERRNSRCKLYTRNSDE
jgi:hypothetical protein